jgi:DNA polymerase-1
MGVAKQARALNVTEAEAKRLKTLFFKVNPYVKTLFDRASEVAERRGFLKTISGRHVHVDSGFTYKALSALIQGSALDQTAEALIQCYEAGIIPISTVHDEINISGNQEKADEVKEIMEKAYKLAVPVVASVGSGENWADAK